MNSRHHSRETQADVPDPTPAKAPWDILLGAFIAGSGIGIMLPQFVSINSRPGWFLFGLLLALVGVFFLGAHVEDTRGGDHVHFYNQEENGR